MKAFSVFAGVGGFDLGFERAGIQVVGQCEINPYCLRVLAKQFPASWRHDDVCTLTGKLIQENCGGIDILCGGFPCQDISDLGQRAGIDGERSGLWRELFRLVCEVRPRYLVVENVAALLHRGMGRVLGDLAGIGFDAEWSVFPVCALGAPHSRERVFLVAYPASGGQRQRRRVKLPKDCHKKGHLYWPSSEPPVARMVDGIPDRSQRLIAMGNSIVPVIAELIGRALMDYELHGPALAAALSPSVKESA